MKEYFHLQSKLISRKFRALGIHPLPGYILTIAGFIVLTILLFQKADYAQYIFIAVSFVVLLPLCELKRNDFLKFHFVKNYVKVRWIENVITSLPFVTFLLIYSFGIEALLVLSTTIVFVFVKTGSSFTLVIPTPFSKTLFEFTVGSRRTYLSILIAFILAVIGTIVPNFNIGAFSLILLFIIMISFYSEPENEYYVWSFNLTPKHFLLRKIKTSIQNATLMMAPVVLLLSIFFFEHIYVILAIIFLGFLGLATMIVAKYSAFPNKMNIPHVILLILSIQLPPLILIIFPYFWFQSLKKLNPLLK